MLVIFAPMTIMKNIDPMFVKYEIVYLSDVVDVLNLRPRTIYHIHRRQNIPLGRDDCIAIVFWNCLWAKHENQQISPRGIVSEDGAPLTVGDFVELAMFFAATEASGVGTSFVDIGAVANNPLLYRFDHNIGQLTSQLHYFVFIYFSLRIVLLSREPGR